MELEPVEWRSKTNPNITITKSVDGTYTANKWSGWEQCYYEIRMYDSETYAWRRVCDCETPHYDSKGDPAKFETLEEAVEKIKKLG